MAETGNLSNTQAFETASSTVLKEVGLSAPRLEVFNMPPSHEERLEWVKKSCERFFEKLLEFDALLGLAELN